MSWIKNNSSSLLITGVVVLIVAAAMVLIMSQLRPTSVLRLGDGIFDARIAATQISREKGLSGVTSLNPQQALILVFPSDRMWSIWMKDMKIPIDIVWLDKAKSVVYSAKNVSPDDVTIFKPNSLTRYVIELPAGTIERQQIQTGDTAVFDIKQETIK